MRRGSGGPAPYRLPHGTNRLVGYAMVTERIQDRLLPDRTPIEAGRLSAAQSPDR